MQSNVKKNCKTATGRDESSYRLLYHFPEIPIKILTDFYNFALKHNYEYIQKEWKTITIIPVPKPHKDLSKSTIFYQ